MEFRSRNRSVSWHAALIVITTVPGACAPMIRVSGGMLVDHQGTVSPVIMAGLGVTASSDLWTTEARGAWAAGLQVHATSVFRRERVPTLVGARLVAGPHLFSHSQRDGFYLLLGLEAGGATDDGTPYLGVGFEVEHIGMRIGRVGFIPNVSVFAGGLLGPGGGALGSGGYSMVVGGIGIVPILCCESP